MLLIGCANLANLMMARATLRTREITLRLALGARRGRVIRMLLTESLFLSTIGALLGVGSVTRSSDGIQSLLPPFYFPPESNVSLDGRVLLFLAVVTILTSIGLGLSPALQASRHAAAEALKEGGRASSAGTAGGLHAPHVRGLQVAAAFILLAGAGVMIRSFQRVMEVDTGYNIEGIVAAYLPLPMERNPEPIALTQYIQQILDEVRAVPGIRDAAVATAIPLRGWGDGMPFRLPAKPDEIVGTGFKIVTPRYFQALGLRVVAGRLLDDRDTAGSLPVVVVNESFVKRYFPNQNALASESWSNGFFRRGAGLVHRWPGRSSAWSPMKRGRGWSPRRTSAPTPASRRIPLSVSASSRGAVATAARSSNHSACGLARQQDAGARSSDDGRAAEGGFDVGTAAADDAAQRVRVAGDAAGVRGIYGVLSFVTAKRTQELGIRAALGASRWDLLRMVVAGGAVPVIAGLAIGLAGAIGAVALHPVDAVPDQPDRCAEPGRRGGAVPGRRARGVPGPGLARREDRPDVSAETGIGNGRWAMGNGRWQMGKITDSLHACHCPSPIAHRPSPIAHSPIAHRPSPMLTVAAPDPSWTGTAAASRRSIPRSAPCRTR